MDKPTVVFCVNARMFTEDYNIPQMERTEVMNDSLSSIVDWLHKTIDVKSVFPSDYDTCNGLYDNGNYRCFANHFAVLYSELTPLIQDTLSEACKRIDAFLVNTSRCECEQPGKYSCGVPGVLAYSENGAIVLGAGVERCDLCERFASDEAAVLHLQKLGLV